MYSKAFILTLGLASLNGALSQTTATIFPGDVQGLDGAQGEIAGTGADGTTYHISASVSGIAATVTLVEDATHLSEVAEAETSGVTVKISQECNYDAQHDGSCSAVIQVDGEGISVATTTTATGSISLNPIALTTAKAAGVSIHSFMSAPIIATIVSGIALLIAA